MRLPHVVIIAGIITAVPGASAQELQRPVGKWRSGLAQTYSNPALAGSGLYLDVDVATDGSFRGTWAQYFCTAYPGAYGIAIHSCSMNPKTKKPVTGRFRPDRRGVIDLAQLGRSEFTWTVPAAGELAIDLPKNWQGEAAILHRARLTRGGKPKAPATSAARVEGPVLSGVALYREFTQDAQAALARHAGKSLVLEGQRGNLILHSDGGAAVHVPDGFQPRALVLYFRDSGEVKGVGEGMRFRFRCTVMNFDYQYLQLDDCSVVR